MKNFIQSALIVVLLIGNGFSQTLTITTTVCKPATSVRLTGPWWSWNPTAGPEAVDNKNGTWTFTFSPAPTATMEYLLVVDGVQENLISDMQNGGTCAPVTDKATYANRQWLTTDGLTVSNTYRKCSACASDELNISVEVCKSNASSVRLTGPWWNWDPANGPVAKDQGNGIWKFTFSPKPTANMEYLIVVDGVQENLISEMQNGGTCAPVTDKATYANRQWLTTDGLTVSNTYGKCSACASDELNISVEVCKSNASSVRLTGPWWNWDPANGPAAKDQGNGIWKFTFSPKPTANMEYLIIVDGVQENLISDMQNGGTCAPVTDYSGYANRRWDLGSGDVSISYDRCVPCSYPDLTVNVQVCDSAKQVNLTGAVWSWNPAWGPQGVNNGDGTWTIKLSPVPNDTLEYLIVKDGVTENLIKDMQNGGGCAPVTDYSSYANRRWISGQGNLAITYDQCGVCLTNSLPKLDVSTINVRPNPTTSFLFIQSEEVIESLNVFGILGEQILSINSIGQLNHQLDLSKCDKGIYFVEVNTMTGSRIHRIVKE